MEKTQKLDKESLRVVADLKSLSHEPKFITWVTVVVRPVIQQLENDLKEPLKYNEIDLKARLLQLNSLRYLFDDVFEQVKQVDTE